MPRRFFSANSNAVQLDAQQMGDLKCLNIREAVPLRVLRFPGLKPRESHGVMVALISSCSEGSKSWRFVIRCVWPESRFGGGGGGGGGGALFFWHLVFGEPNAGFAHDCKTRV